MRTPLPASCFLLAACGLLPRPARAGEEGSSWLDDVRRKREDHLHMPPAAEQAADAALKFLSSRQIMQGALRGSFHQYNGADTGVVASCLLAYMASGSLPGRGKYGKQTALAVDYFLKWAQDWRPDPQGRPQKFLYRKGSKGGPMYHHALSTLALVEVWGETRDPRVGKTAKAAINLIVSSQTVGKDLKGRSRYGSKHGGWRYQPRPGDADLSATVMQIVALRAAQNSGIRVPRKTIDDAVAFVKRCYHNRQGGFTYMPRHGRTNAGLTGGGTLSLQLSGLYEEPEVKKGVRFILRSPMKSYNTWRYYAFHYTAQAMYQHGAGWEEFYQKILGYILADQQRSRGRSDLAGSITYRRLRSGRHYATAVGVQVMCIPKRYLPIYQR